MRVKMLVQISGTRDGRDWPKPGTVVDLPEGADLIASGLAVAAGAEVETAEGDTEPVEAAVAAGAEVETAEGDTKPKRRRRP